MADIRLHSRWHRTRAALLVMAATAAAACARTTSSADLTGFGTAAAALGRQTDASFADANRIARIAAVDRFARSSSPALTEDAFAPSVPPAVANDWRAAFASLARYGLLLGTLTNADQGTRTTTAFRDLGVALRAEPVGAQISPGIAAGFATLAGTLVDLGAQKQAIGILRRTNPAVRALLTDMAAAIGANDREGLRGTVWTNWTAATGRQQRDYAMAAARGDEDAKRALATDYLATLDRRDAQLASLANLRTSLLELATAHAAAAAGSRRSLGEVLVIIDTRLDTVAKLAKDIEESGQ